MDTLRIFCDLTADDEVLSRLRAGIAPHQLLTPAAPARTVLAQSAPDPALYDANIAFGQPDAKALLDAPQLRWAQISSAGYTRYDSQEFRVAAKAKGLVLTNSSSVYAEPCVEHLLGFLLAQARSLPNALGANCPNDSARWAALRSEAKLLRGQRALILGYGAIGAMLLPVLRSLQMEVLAFRRSPTGQEDLKIVRESELNEALAWADHVMSVLPENQSTLRFMDHRRFHSMRSGAIFYNIGRGKTVDQEALLSALRSGHLAAAWLDVTDPEPLPRGHPLLSAPNCYITPHVAGGHAGEHMRLVCHFLENLPRFISGAEMADRVL